MLARIAAASFLAIAGGALAALPDYDIVEIYQGNAPSHAFDVSNTGIVVGCYGAPATAFSWQNGQRTDLFAGCATAVNDNGVVGGYDANGNALVWNNGTITMLGVTGQVNGINNAGWAVASNASFQGNTYVQNDYLFHDGQLEKMPVGCSVRINNLNQVLCSGGTIRNADGSMIVMPGTSYPGGFDYATFPSPRGLTDRTQVVGQGRGLVYYENGVTTQVAHTYSDAGAIDLNSWPLMVGDEEGFFGYIANLQGESKYLSQMSGLQGTWWSKLGPRKINESGWIVGTATYGPTFSGGEAFLMIPKAAPPPPTPGTPIAGLPVMKRQRMDLNADGRNDLLWRGSDGTYGAWLMDGNDVMSAGAIAAPANASVVLRGDFDGDYRGDIVFKDAAGAYWVTLMNGTSATTKKVLDGGTGWTPIAVGDFNGDLKQDLLWYHATQGFGVWLMNGATILSAAPTNFPANGWPAAIGDFNGDRRDDILWTFPDGHFQLFTMNGATGTDAGTVRAAGSAYVPAFVANFNGDGRDDIVWSNPDGSYSLWLMDGAATVNSTAILGPGTGWHVIGTPDFDGNGTADLLFRADDGSIGGWTMSGTTQTGYRLFIGGGSGWDVVLDNEVSGDYKADLLWRNVDGSYGLWLMNGLNPASTKVILPGGTGWELVAK